MNLITTTFGFSGYLLPLDQLAHWATTTGVENASKGRVVPAIFLFFLGAALIAGPIIIERNR